MARPTPQDPQNTAPLASYHGGASLPPALPPGHSPFGGGGGNGPGGNKNSPTPMGLLNALKRRWVLATFIGLLAAVMAGSGVWLAMPGGNHKGRVSVQLRPTSGEIGNRGEDFDSFRRDQMFILKTRDILSRTVSEPAVGSLSTIRESDEPIRFLEEGLKIEAPTPQILTVTLTGDKPDELKVILDTLVRKYVDEARSFELAVRDARRKKLEKVVENLREEIQAMDGRIKRLSETAQVSGKDGNDQARVGELQVAQARTRAEIAEMEKHNQELRSLIDLYTQRLKAGQINLDPKEMQKAVDADVRIAGPAQERAVKQALYARQLKNGMVAEAPTMMELKDSIARLTEEITAKRAEVLPELEKEVRANSLQLFSNKIDEMKDKLVVDEKILESRRDYLKQLERTSGNFNVSTIELGQLMKEVEPQREYLHRVQKELIEINIQKEQEPRVSIREAAFVILNQNLKQKTLFAAAAAIAAFGLVVAVVALLEWRTRRIDGIDQVVGELGMRIIGTVPAFPTKASLKAASEGRQANWRFVLNESVNSTRTMLLHTARNQSMQVVMVTSATQGEGKTSLSSQLATSMATAGMRTLVVDCDLRNPSIHKLFDLQMTPGVSEVLVGDVDVSDAVQPTTVPNLWVIPAGQCSNRVISALAQGHPLETLFNRLRGQFDFVIVDSCPVLPVADALLIGQHVDGVLFSIMQDVSQLPKVMTASEKLTQLNIAMLGAVVNGTRNDVHSYGYNYVKQLPA